MSNFRIARTILWHLSFTIRSKQRWWWHGKLAVLDISENGRQIAEKLLILLNDTQRQELAEYIFQNLDQPVSSVKHPCAAPAPISHGYVDQLLTEIREGELYFCLELRKVCVGDTEVELTVKEFDALHLLISNRNRILTFETLACQIWGEEYIDITAKTIHNLMSRLRHKLQVAPDSHNYIDCVRGVGYKFDAGNKRHNWCGNNTAFQSRI